MRIRDVFDTLIDKHDPIKRNQNIPAFYAIVKNSQTYTVNDKLNMLRPMPPKSNSYCKSVKASSDDHLNEKEDYFLDQETHRARASAPPPPLPHYPPLPPTTPHTLTTLPPTTPHPPPPYYPPYYPTAPDSPLLPRLLPTTPYDPLPPTIPYYPLLPPYYTLLPPTTPRYPFLLSPYLPLTP